MLFRFAEIAWHLENNSLDWMSQCRFGLLSPILPPPLLYHLTKKWLKCWTFPAEHDTRTLVPRTSCFLKGVHMCFLLKERAGTVFWVGGGVEGVITGNWPYNRKQVEAEQGSAWNVGTVKTIPMEWGESTAWKLSVFPVNSKYFPKDATKMHTMCPIPTPLKLILGQGMPVNAQKNNEENF